MMELKHKIEYRIQINGSVSFIAFEKKMATPKKHRELSGKSLVEAQLKYPFLIQYHWCRTVFNWTEKDFSVRFFMIIKRNS